MKPCETCRFYLPRDKASPATKRTYAVDTCMNRHTVNRFGTLAVTMARAETGRCGPDATFWKPEE